MEIREGASGVDGAMKTANVRFDLKIRNTSIQQESSKGHSVTM